MKVVSARDAVERIPDGSNVFFPHSAVETAAIDGAFSAAVERFRELTVFSGLSFGGYRFLERGLGRCFRYRTWQVSPRLRTRVAAGEIDLVPLRYSEIPRLVRRAGPIRPDVVVTRVAPPLRKGGPVNLGISTSLHAHWIREAGLVIAEIDPAMPRTRGASIVPSARIDLAVEATAPLVEVPLAATSERSLRIVDRVLGLVPEGATVQLGVGSVPDGVLRRLAEAGRVALFSGILTEGLVDFLEAAPGTPTVVTGELVGTRRLYDWCDRNRRIRMAPAAVTHDVRRLASIRRFVSVNSAVEIDLHGQVNGETIGSLQISGVGGSLDYMEAAALSDGGVSIVAMPSTTEDGSRSRIVRMISPGAVVTAPRHCVDTVVTEHGVARLRGKSLRERAEALIAIADPSFRDSLASEGTDPFSGIHLTQSRGR